MQLGALVPFHDTGGDPDTVRDTRRRWKPPVTIFWRRRITSWASTPIPVRVGILTATRRQDLFHDPFVLLSYVSGVAPKLLVSTGVLIMAQRQTVLIAKQAACLDVLCKGRFRLGSVSVERSRFVGLNENFRNRGRRSEEQVAVMRALWKDEHVTFKGEYQSDRRRGHRSSAHRRGFAGLVRWASRKDTATHRQMGRRLDHEQFPAGPDRADHIGELRGMIEAEGRDPSRLGSRFGLLRQR